jgi:Ca-activated chloride channel family protein
MPRSRAPLPLVLGSLALAVTACSKKLDGAGESVAARASEAWDAPAATAPAPEITRDGNTESYTHQDPNPWTAAAEDRLSTFAVDVDTGSYTILRKKILAGEPVPPDAVRVEELLNYFHYSDAPPDGDAPLAIHTELAPSPWRPGAYLLRVALKGREVPAAARKKAHLVFLVDVSGSMEAPDKLPLVKQSLRLLVDSLRPDDTVSLVTYAGATRVVLEPTRLSHRGDILEAIAALDAGGSTAMASGLDLAYDRAARTLSPDSISRVVLLTDGDTNVGPTSFESILEIIAGRAKEGVTLSAIGVGMGNYKDSLLEQLADEGDGNYHYIDGLAEARRVFQEQLGGTVEVIARDAKVQVELDPALVDRYRLVGYENRAVADRDFRDDEVDGGEIGSGHAVTALYELVLKDRAPRGDIALVRVRAKPPRGGEAGEWTQSVSAARRSFDSASADFRFAAAVMAAGEILRHSPDAEGWDLGQVRAVASAAAGDIPERAEFVALLARASGDKLTAR